MSEIVREDPPWVASELTMLNSYLDYHRATLLKKVAGVSDADLRRASLQEAGLAAVTPGVPGLTLLGLVKHMAYGERWWFQTAYAGLDVPHLWTDEDGDADLRVEPHETTAEILELYQKEVARSRQIVSEAVREAGSETAALASHPKNPQYAARSLLWIMLDMITEMARHNGHADILREIIDGEIGV